MQYVTSKMGRGIEMKDLETIAFGCILSRQSNCALLSASSTMFFRSGDLQASRSSRLRISPSHSTAQGQYLSIMMSYSVDDDLRKASSLRSPCRPPP